MLCSSHRRQSPWGLVSSKSIGSKSSQAPGFPAPNFILFIYEWKVTTNKQRQVLLHLPTKAGDNCTKLRLPCRAARRTRLSTRAMINSNRTRNQRPRRTSARPSPWAAPARRPPGPPRPRMTTATEARCRQPGSHFETPTPTAPARHRPYQPVDVEPAPSLAAGPRPAAAAARAIALLLHHHLLLLLLLRRRHLWLRRGSRFAARGSAAAPPWPPPRTGPLGHQTPGHRHLCHPCHRRRHWHWGG